MYMVLGSDYLLDLQRSTSHNNVADLFLRELGNEAEYPGRNVFQNSIGMC